MKFRHLQLISFLLLVLIGGSNAIAQQFTVGNLKYDFGGWGDGLSVCGYTGNLPSRLNIPETVEHNNNTYLVAGVRRFDYHSFSNQFWGVFECSGGQLPHIDTIDFGNGVRHIGENTCRSNIYLKHVYFGNNLESISQNAFRDCWYADRHLVFPESLKTIGKAAFFKFGKNNSSIAAYALVIPSNVTYISRQAFYEAQFPSLIFHGDLLTCISEEAFYKAICGSGTLALPNHVVTVYNKAFYDCDFTSVTTGEYLKKIYKQAFYGCDDMQTLTLGRSVDSIGQQAFAQCSSLNNVVCLSVYPPRLSSNAFQGIASNATLTVPAGSFEAYFNSSWHDYFPNIIEEGATGISFIAQNLRYRVNADNNSVTLLGAADGATISGTQVFGGTVSYNGHTYNVTKIGNDAFKQNTGITVVSIQSPIEEIGANAFTLCTALNSVALPNTLKRIEYGAFAICPNLHLSTAGFPNSLEYIGTFAFWSCAMGNVTFGNSLKTIGTGAFMGSGISGQLNLPNSLEFIGEGAFENCSGLTGSLNIPSSVWYIGDHAFWQCINLSGTLNIPSGVTHLGVGAFKGCTGFTGQLHTPSSITEIPNSAFEGCTGITGWTCLSTVRSIGNSAFKDSGLQDLRLGAELDSIAPYAFYGCSSMMVVNVKEVEGVPGIAVNAFNGVPCTHLVVPCGMDIYYEASAWSAHFTDIEAECHDGYSFEDNTLNDWTTIDADGDGNNWFVIEEAEYQSAHSGSYYVTSASYWGGTWLYPDNYIVSPQKGRYSQIRFYARTSDMSYPNEHFGVAVSTGNNTNPNFFTTIQEWTMTTKEGGSWHEYTVDLSGYDEDIWVAIRHFNCSDQARLCVDDIALSSLPIISNIQLEGFTLPEFGEHPDFNLEVPEIAPYAIEQVRWLDNGNDMSTTSVFNNESHSYVMWVTLTPAPGFSFAEDAMVSYDGDISIHNEAYNVLNADGSIIVPTIEFTVHQGLVSSINVDGFTAPVWGEHPDFDLSVDPSANYTLEGVYWLFMNSNEYIYLTSGDVFNREDGNYLMEVEIAPKSGYHFDNTTALSFNGDATLVNPSTSIIYDGHYYVDSYSFNLIDGVFTQSVNNIAIYPNPTKDVVKINAKNLKNVAIYNMMGQKVFETEVSGDEFEYNFNGSTGMYLIRVETKKGVETNRVVVM